MWCSVDGYLLYRYNKCTGTGTINALSLKVHSPGIRKLWPISQSSPAGDDQSNSE